MKIAKSRAIELIDEKISEFTKISENIIEFKNYGTIVLKWEEEYQKAYQGSVHLIDELFSKEEANKFKTIVAAKPFYNLPMDFKEHVKDCIIQLKLYKERIQEFWPDDGSETIKKEVLLPFVSMSFSEKDRDINKYFTGILDALQIEFETGERYSKESVPEKVRNRIRSCDLLIGILVKRDRTIDGRFKIPEWLIKEVGIAQGAGKDVIVLVERGVTDTAGLRSEKEIIYFERENTKEIQTATLKFLEALKEHGLA